MVISDDRCSAGCIDRAVVRGARGGTAFVVTPGTRARATARCAQARASAPACSATTRRSSRAIGSASAFDIGGGTWFRRLRQTLLGFASRVLLAPARRAAVPARHGRAGSTTRRIGGAYALRPQTAGSRPWSRSRTTPVPFDSSQWVGGTFGLARGARNCARAGYAAAIGRRLPPAGRSPAGRPLVVHANGVDPQKPDNMFSFSLPRGGPKYLYFSERNDAEPRSSLPQDTFELDRSRGSCAGTRFRAQPAFELARRGFAVGFDAVYRRWRANWEGLGGIDRSAAARSASAAGCCDFSTCAVARDGPARIPGQRAPPRRSTGARGGGAGGSIASRSRAWAAARAASEFCRSRARRCSGAAGRRGYHAQALAPRLALAEYRYELLFFTF